MYQPPLILCGQEQTRTLIKWCSPSSVYPGVPQCDVVRTVVDNLGELATVPKGLLFEVENHHVMKPVVDINPAAERRVFSSCVVQSLSLRCSHEILIPLYSIGVEILIEGPPSHRMPSVCLPPSVKFGHRAPIERSSNDICALFRVQRPVPSGLHYINFSMDALINSHTLESKSRNSPAHRPGTIGAVHRKHPNRWPEPIAFRECQ